MQTESKTSQSLLVNSRVFNLESYPYICDFKVSILENNNGVYPLIESYDEEGNIHSIHEGYDNVMSFLFNMDIKMSEEYYNECHTYSAYNFVFQYRPSKAIIVLGGDDYIIQ